MSIRQDYEVADIGGGFGGLGGGNAFVWIIVLILIFLFFFKRDDHGHGYNEYNNNNCGVKGCRPAFYDESNWETEVHIKDKVTCEEEKTRGLIVHQAEIAAQKEFARSLATETELKGKINMLQTEKYVDQKFDGIMGKMQYDYNQVIRELDKKPSTAPCYACKEDACTFKSPSFNPCDFGPRRRDCDC